MKQIPFLRILISSLAIAVIVLSTGCEAITPFLSEVTPTPGEPTPTATPLVEAMYTFRVTLPEPLQPGDSIYLTLLDEVSGLALNPTRHLMEAEDAQHFFVILPFELNSLLKYRYSREGSRYAEEHLSDGRMVRYRMVWIVGPGVVQDTVSRWTDTTFEGPTGRIRGQALDSSSGQAIPNLLISAGGASSLTTSDGSFLLEGLPPGTHNLVAYALDGAYQLYQQGALVAADSTTPAVLELNPAKKVKVEFIVTPPPGTIPAVPIRLAGSLFQLGNTFGDLNGGVSLMATRMPVLQPLADGRYSITLELPAGEDLHYKYTLGDGFWNAERFRDGSTRLRRLVVPDHDTTIDDTIATWSNGPTSPITFDITTPDDTPVGEMVSIQLNPGFGWTEPIPMWPVGGNRWVYVLFSPLEYLDTLAYRYCRNEQCGVADDARTAGITSPGFLVSPAEESLTVNDRVEAWVGISEPLKPITVPDMPVANRGQSFMAGVEFQENYHPSWQAHLPAAMKDIASLNANWVVICPSWTYTRQNLPVLEVVPGQDPLWTDLVSNIQQASEAGLHLALYPTARFPADSEEWWLQASRDFPWWTVWFERYERFILHHADLAESQGAGALILGGEWLTPVLPNGLVADGSSSRVPEDAEARWRELLGKVRERFSGKLLWALTFPEDIESPPAFIDEFDQIYVLWSAALSEQPGESQAEMTAQALELLESLLQPFYEMTAKPLVIGLAYPSVTGGATGLVDEGADGELNLQEQVDAYNAMFAATNEVEWVEGLVSRGYYPPAVMQDTSPSLHGKPARGVLWYWFGRMVVE
jgi:hypothetical protein